MKNIVDLHFSDFCLEVDVATKVKQRKTDSWALDDEEKNVLEISNKSSALYISVKKIDRSDRLERFIIRNGMDAKEIKSIILNEIDCDYIRYNTKEIFAEWWLYGDRMVMCIVLRGNSEEDCRILREAVNSVRQHRVENLN